VAAAAVLVAGAASAAPGRLASTSVSYRDPAWSPRGTRIAFVAVTTVASGDLSSSTASLETMDPDGRNLRVVVTGDPGRIAWPTWSPDGRRIAFGYDHLYVVGSGGGRPRDLGGGGCCPAWGPGGRKIAYSGGPETQSEVFVMNPDGSRKEHVADPDQEHSYWGPTWSPKGQKLAFYADEAPDMAGHVKTSLAMISRFGGKVRYLRSGSYASQPDWSPNGRKIAYDGIRVLDLATNRVARLHEGVHPRWSPDGRRLAFVDDHQIFVMRADGSSVRQVTR
jgi:Tol biopolymer transport system component